MNWVIVLVALGLTGIIVEMLLSCLTNANEIRAQRTQKEQLIQAHQHAIEQAKTETEKTTSRLSDLEVTSKDVKRMFSEAQKQIRTLQAAQQRRHPTRHKLNEEQ